MSMSYIYQSILLCRVNHGYIVKYIICVIINIINGIINDVAGYTGNDENYTLIANRIVEA
jgi:hypothetical protein